MKKLLIIAAASFFTFTSCSKVEPTPVPQQTSVSQTKPNPLPPAPITHQQYVITNIESNWGVVEYRLTYTDQNNLVQSIVLNMGQSITLCLSNSAITTNFAYTIVFIGNC